MGSSRLTSLEGLEKYDQICASFNVRRASRLVTKFYAKNLRNVSLEPTQFTLLVACSQQDSVSVGTLAKRKGTEPSALSRNLAIMEKRGLLKVSAGVDRRTRNVMITELGWAALSGGYPYWRDAQLKIQNGFGEARLQKLLRELRQLALCAEKMGAS